MANKTTTEKVEQSVQNRVNNALDANKSSVTEIVNLILPDAQSEEAQKIREFTAAMLTTEVYRSYDYWLNSLTLKLKKDETTEVL